VALQVVQLFTQPLLLDATLRLAAPQRRLHSLKAVLQHFNALRRVLLHMFAITLERFLRFRLRLFSHLLQLTGKGVALTPQQLHSFFKPREALLQRRPLLVTIFQQFGFSGTVGLGSLHGCLGFVHL